MGNDVSRMIQNRTLLDEIPISMRYSKEAYSPMSVPRNDYSIPVSSRYQDILKQKGISLDSKPANFVQDSMNLVDIHGSQPLHRCINPSVEYDPRNILPS